MKFHEFAVGHL